MGGGEAVAAPAPSAARAPNADRRLVEPFCGGLSVTLGLDPDRALLNDANAPLVDFYRWLGRGLELDIPMANEAELFYAHRRRFNELLRDGHGHTREAASLFYFLNRTGYNGLCRFNGRGEFNVPFGRYARIAYRRDFRPYAPVLSRWTFTSGDFSGMPLGRDDFVYADPPTTCRSPSTSSGAPRGTTRCARPSGSRATRAPSFS